LRCKHHFQSHAPRRRVYWSSGIEQTGELLFNIIFIKYWSFSFTERKRGCLHIQDDWSSVFTGIPCGVRSPLFDWERIRPRPYILHVLSKRFELRRTLEPFRADFPTPTASYSSMDHQFGRRKCWGQLTWPCGRYREITHKSYGRFQYGHHWEGRDLLKIDIISFRRYHPRAQFFIIDSMVDQNFWLTFLQNRKFSSYNFNLRCLEIVLGFRNTLRKRDRLSSWMYYVRFRSFFPFMLHIFLPINVTNQLSFTSPRREIVMSVESLKFALFNVALSSLFCPYYRWFISISTLQYNWL